MVCNGVWDRIRRYGGILRDGVECVVFRWRVKSE